MGSHGWGNYSLGTAEPCSKFFHALMVVVNAGSPVLNQLPIASAAEFFCSEEGVAQGQRGAVECRLMTGVLAMIALFEIFNKVEAKLII